jgi:hypothetical protein
MLKGVDFTRPAFERLEFEDLEIEDLEFEDLEFEDLEIERLEPDGLELTSEYPSECHLEHAPSPARRAHETGTAHSS